MLLLAVSVLIQIALVVHIIRTGRNQLWLLAVVMLPVAGTLAYIVAELLPEWMGSRGVRSARAKVEARLDPERELRAAKDALELADTVANRVRTGDALAQLGRHGEALAMYEDALARTPGEDPRLAIKTAAAAHDAGRAARANDLLAGVPPHGNDSDQDRRLFLEARVAEALGDNERALRIYRDVVTRLPGDEARCRYAALLIAAGRAGEAKAVLEEVEAREKRLDRHARAEGREMYAWASAKLGELRG